MQRLALLTALAPAYSALAWNMQDEKDVSGVSCMDDDVSGLPCSDVATARLPTATGYRAVGAERWRAGTPSRCGNLSSHVVAGTVGLPLTPAAIAAAAARWHAQLDQHLTPRLLHYTWSDCSSVPPRQSAWQKGCARVNPLHQQWLWSDHDNRALVATHYPRFLDLYDSYDEHMKRVDAARLFYLHRVEYLIRR